MQKKEILIIEKQETKNPLCQSSSSIGKEIQQNYDQQYQSQVINNPTVQSIDQSQDQSNMQFNQNESYDTLSAYQFRSEKLISHSSYLGHNQRKNLFMISDDYQLKNKHKQDVSPAIETPDLNNNLYRKIDQLKNRLSLIKTFNGNNDTKECYLKQDNRNSQLLISGGEDTQIMNFNEESSIIQKEGKKQNEERHFGNSYSFPKQSQLFQLKAYYDRGLLVISRVEIAKNNFKGIFWINLVSTLSLAFLPFENQILNLMFLIRLVQINIHLDKLDQVFSIKFKYNIAYEMSSLGLIIIFQTHLFGCLLHWVAHHEHEHGNQKNWLDENGFIDLPLFERYINSIYFVIISMSTIGYGDISPVSIFEKIIIIFMAIISTGFFGYAINKIGDIFIKVTRQKKEFEQKKYTAQRYLHHRNIPHCLIKKILQNLEYQETKQYYRNELGAKIIESVDEQLNVEFKREFFGKILEKYKPFKMNFSSKTMDLLTQQINEEFTSKGQIIFQKGQACQKLYVLIKGKISIFQDDGTNVGSFSLGQISEGKFFGVNSFLGDNPYEYSTKSESDCHLLVISREQFAQTIKNNIQDWEIYRKIHDDITINQNKLFEGLKCTSCEAEDHTIQHCRYLHFQPIKSLIIAKHLYSKEIGERKKQKRKFFSHSCLQLLDQTSTKLKKSRLDFLGIYYQYNFQEEQIQELLSIAVSDRDFYRMMPKIKHNSLKLSFQEYQLEKYGENWEQQLDRSSRLSSWMGGISPPLPRKDQILYNNYDSLSEDDYDDQDESFSDSLTEVLEENILEEEECHTINRSIKEDSQYKQSPSKIQWSVNQQGENHSIGIPSQLDPVGGDISEFNSIKLNNNDAGAAKSPNSPNFTFQFQHAIAKTKKQQYFVQLYNQILNQQKQFQNQLEKQILILMNQNQNNDTHDTSEQLVQQSGSNSYISKQQALPRNSLQLNRDLQSDLTLLIHNNNNNNNNNNNFQGGDIQSHGNQQQSSFYQQSQINSQNIINSSPTKNDKLQNNDLGVNQTDKIRQKYYIKQKKRSEDIKSDTHLFLDNDAIENNIQYSPNNIFQSKQCFTNKKRGSEVTGQSSMSRLQQTSSISNALINNPSTNIKKPNQGGSQNNISFDMIDTSQNKNSNQFFQYIRHARRNSSIIQPAQIALLSEQRQQQKKKNSRLNNTGSQSPKESNNNNQKLVNLQIQSPPKKMTTMLQFLTELQENHNSRNNNNNAQYQKQQSQLPNYSKKEIKQILYNLQNQLTSEGNHQQERKKLFEPFYNPGDDAIKEYTFYFPHNNFSYVLQLERQLYQQRIQFKISQQRQQKIQKNQSFLKNRRTTIINYNIKSDLNAAKKINQNYSVIKGSRSNSIRQPTPSI